MRRCAGENDTSHAKVAGNGPRAAGACHGGAVMGEHGHVV
jgi:hypothetical protein